jgi:hypothetical protein
LTGFGFASPRYALTRAFVVVPAGIVFALALPAPVAPLGRLSGPLLFAATRSASAANDASRSCERALLRRANSGELADITAATTSLAAASSLAGFAATAGDAVADGGVVVVGVGVGAAAVGVAAVVLLVLLVVVVVAGSVLTSCSLRIASAWPGEIFAISAAISRASA